MGDYDCCVVLEFQCFSSLAHVTPSSYTNAIARAAQQSNASLLVLVKLQDRQSSPWYSGQQQDEREDGVAGSLSAPGPQRITPVQAWTTLERFLAHAYSAATRVFLARQRLTSRVDVVLDDLRGGIPFCIPRGATVERIQLQDKMTGHVDDAARAQLGSYEVTALGGTFDHLHAGHKILLTMAASVTTRKLICGVTDEALLGKKEYKEYLESVPERINKTRQFLELVRPTCQHDVVAIQDPYGPTAYEPDIQALVVSEETRAGGEAVNKKRREQSLNELDTLVIELVADDAKTDGGVSAASKLGSTGIRRWLHEQEESKTHMTRAA
ncbi:hypothetical protein OIV83_003309 [Microbotryomycetes sp. JL201]|nr:hypothetical protein OIV83_003309 [Microbotryomycetes sp. JL201]